jgi:hypothetical protein
MWNKTITHSNELSCKGREIHPPQDCQKLVTDEDDCGATYGYAHAATVQLIHWVWNHLAGTLFPKVTVPSVSPTKRKSTGSQWQQDSYIYSSHSKRKFLHTFL